MNGYSLRNNALQSKAGMAIATLKLWDDRKAPALQQQAVFSPSCS